MEFSLENAAVLLHAGDLKIARSLADAATLVDELQTLRASISEAGFASFSARSGKHDDLVLAVAIAAWWMLRAPRGTTVIHRF